MKKLLLITAALLIISTGVVSAQRATGSTTGRQVAQRGRIVNGVKDKELTRPEAMRLKREQRKIEIEKRVVKADGNVTRAEKKFLRREQNRANKHIARQKNDGQKRKF